MEGSVDGSLLTGSLSSFNLVNRVVVVCFNVI